MTFPTTHEFHCRPQSTQLVGNDDYRMSSGAKDHASNYRIVLTIGVRSRRSGQGKHAVDNHLNLTCCGSSQHVGNGCVNIPLFELRSHKNPKKGLVCLQGWPKIHIEG